MFATVSTAPLKSIFNFIMFKEKRCKEATIFIPVPPERHKMLMGTSKMW